MRRAANITAMIIRGGTFNPRCSTVISVIIPTINEEKSIGPVVDRIRANLDSVTSDYEIIIVDTNSRDRTTEIAQQKGCRVVREPERGYGRAYKTGFGAAAGETIITMDADASYPPEAIPFLLGIFNREQLDFITANRFGLRLNSTGISLKRTCFAALIFISSENGNPLLLTFSLSKTDFFSIHIPLCVSLNLTPNRTLVVTFSIQLPNR